MGEVRKETGVMCDAVVLIRVGPRVPGSDPLARYSAFNPAALIIGNHLSISAL